MLHILMLILFSKLVNDTIGLRTPIYNYQNNNLNTWNTSTTNKNQHKSNSRSSEAQNIIFMDEDQPLQATVNRSLFSIKDTPNCANGTTFCKEMPNYPHAQIDKILQNSNVNQEIFKLVDSFFQSRKIDFQDDFVCKSIREVIRPEGAKNYKNQWKYIINQKANTGFVQELEIETCLPSYAPCGLYPPPGYTSGCKQKYLYRRLLAFSNEGKPIVDIFSFPSACACSYKQDKNKLKKFFRRPHVF